jgi:hypothetical protein
VQSFRAVKSSRLGLVLATFYNKSTKLIVDPSKSKFCKIEGV